MDFHSDKPIYRQIVDYCYGCVLSGTWQPGGKVPSVRELAVQLAVNTHTILKAYESLQGIDIIRPKRGMGYYLTDDAKERINKARRQEFFDDTIPALKQEMAMLGITVEEIVDAIR